MARFNHPVDVACEMDVPAVLPLRAREDGGKREVMGCSTCHDPHRWDTTGGSPDPTREGSALDSFLRIPNGEDSRLCASCHPRQADLRGTDHDLLARLANPGPIDPPYAGLCAGCHLPHGNDPARELWTWGLSANGAGNERACMKCHERGGPAEEKAIRSGHFTGPVPAGRVRAPLPLFPPAGPGDQDLLLCATCHDPHHWSPEGPPAKEGAGPANREGTGESSFLRMVSRGDAPLCLACHDGKATVIGTDHDLRILPPRPAGGIQIPDITASGVCSPCHGAHNVSGRPFLWARDLTVGTNIEQQICFSCHQTGEMAGDKVPPRYGHPDVLTASVLERAGRRLSLEAADHLPEEHAPHPGSGIHCFVCHDAHRWSPDEQAAAPGRPVEGDAGSSFLLEKSFEHFCNLCHGNEGLYRYLYFHRWREEQGEG